MSVDYTFRQGDLPKLDVQIDRGTDFIAWRTQWDAYGSLSGLDQQAAAKQVQALMLCFSRETLAVVHNLGLTEDQMKDPAAIITALQRYVDGHVNETVERRNLRRRVQQPGESFDDFLIALRELAKTCKFCSDRCMQKGIRDQIIEGLSDGDTIEDLLQVSDLTLQVTIDKCRSREAAKKNRSDITHSPEVVAAVRRPTHPIQPIKQATCPGCGGPHHKRGRSFCPAYDQLCAACHKVGHFARVCRSKPQQMQSHGSSTTPGANAIRVQRQEDAKCQLYNVQQDHTAPAPTITIQVTSSTGTKAIDVLPDSGADISAAGQETLSFLGHHIDNLLPSSINPKTVNGTTMTPWGKVQVTLKLGQQTCEEDLHIYPGISGTIISWKAAKALDILPQHYPYPPNWETNYSPEHVLQATTTTSSDIPTAGQLVQQYSTVFDGQVTTMVGESFAIALAEGAKPFCVKAPRSVPFAYREKLKSELELLQQQNIIAPVTQVTEWCAPIVVTPKKGTERIRMCVDLSRLNRYVRRERYHSPTPAEAVADIAAEEACIFTVLDAMKGYHQCPLAEDSQHLTTFITPFGRFKYLRAPYGLSSIAEHYNRRMAEAFEGLTGFRRIVDDIVIYDKDIESHASHVKQFLQRCQERHIALNKDKCRFFQQKVTFAGFELSSTGYCIDSSVCDAITKFPTLASRTDLRSFFGLVNQVASSTNKIAELLAPLRPLLSTKNEFLWTPDHDQAINKAKSHLTNPPTLAFFDIRKPTRLSTDASRHGIGFVLQQQKQPGEWTLTQAGSRFLSDAESRYAVIELELLAVAWAVLKCKMFLAGISNFTIITDHSPLIPILNSHRLDEIENPRLQRLRTRLMAYSFTAVWCKGAANQAPDALSRHPVAEPRQTELLAEYDEQSALEPSISEIRAMATTESLNFKLTELRECANQDDEYQALKKVILQGFPDHKSQLPHLCTPYWHIRHHLTVDDDLIVHGCRLVIPTAMRRQMCTDLHMSHQGIVRTKQRARLTLYWPGMDNDIENTVAGCSQCQAHLPSNPKEPLQCKPAPARPFQELAADFCQHAGRNYLIVIDCLTDWPTIVPMGRQISTKHLLTALTELFSRTAIPDVIWSDRGPQFTANHFQAFATKWGIQHRTSTPHYPQSNGKAESAVKSMKKLIRAAWMGNHLDEETLCKSLLQYRNTPSRKDGLSPAQKLYGQPVQDSLPAHRLSFAPEWQRSVTEAEVATKRTQEKVKEHYNKTAHQLRDIQIGSHVALQNPRTRLWDTYGIVTSVGPYRQYHIRTQHGNTLVRNRRFIRRRIVTSAMQTCSEVNLQIDSRQQIPVRQSQRTRKATKRLIEDPQWP